MATRKSLLETPVMPSTLEHPVAARVLVRSPSLDAEARNQVYRQWLQRSFVGSAGGAIRPERGGDRARRE